MGARAAIVRAALRRAGMGLMRRILFPENPMDSSFLTSVVPLVAVFAIMYFLLIRPQQQRVKEHKKMVDNVGRGDTVVTAGGLVGKVAKPVKPEDSEVTVEIADNVQVKVMKATLSEVRPKNAPAND
jgi:preprotein translocase subunit YajC